MADVPLRYTADLADVKAQLAQLSGMTEAQVARQLKAMNSYYAARAKAEREAAKNAKTSWLVSEQGVGKTKESMAGLAAAASVLSPALGSVVQQGSALTGALKSVAGAGSLAGPAVGAVTVALGAGAYAWSRVTKEIEAERAAAEFAAQVNDTLERSLRRLEDANLDLAVAVGTLTEEEGYRQKVALNAQRSVLEFADSQKAQRKELEASIETSERWLKVSEYAYGGLPGLSDAFKYVADSVFGWSDSIDDAQGKLARLDKAVQDEAATQKELRDVLERVNEVREANKRSTKQATEAERDAERVAREQARALEQLVAIREQAQLGVLDGELRLHEEYRRQIADIAELEEVSGDHHEAEMARYAVKVEAMQKLTLLRREGERNEEEATAKANARLADYAKGQQNAWDARREAHAGAQAEIQDLAEQTGNWTLAQQAASRESASFYLDMTEMTATAIGDIAGSVASTVYALAERLAEGSKESAMKVYRAYQAIAIVEATVSTIAGAARALKDYPYPYSLVVAGLVAAQGAVQIGLIASESPSFADTPRPMRAGSQGMTARFAAGDIVVAGRDERDLVRQMQRAGIGMGGTQVLVRDADRHHGRYGRDPMRPPDRYDPMRRRAGRVPGRV